MNMSKAESLKCLQSLHLNSLFRELNSRDQKRERRFNRIKMLDMALSPQEMKRICCHLVLGSSPYVTALYLGSQCLIDEQCAMMITVPTSSGKKFLSSPKCPDRLWGPSSLLFSGGKSGRGVNLTKPASSICYHGVETDNFILTLPLTQTEAFLVQTGLRTVTENIKFRNNSRVPVYQCGISRPALQGTCINWYPHQTENWHQM
jgi:hypothetical protein